MTCRSCLGPAAGLALLAAVMGCTPPRAAAEVRAEFGEFSPVELLELGAFTADLEILLDDGSPGAAWVQVNDPAGGASAVLVESPVPMRCEAGACEIALQMTPGRYRFTMLLHSTDRCGRRALLGAFRSSADAGGVRLNAYGPVLLNFDEVDWSFDDDGDSIENVLELSVCGRFDLDERDLAPTQCEDGADLRGHPCCLAKGSQALADATSSFPELARRTWGSNLAGEMTFFAGGEFTAYPGSDPATANVAPFWIDATEVTWGELGRCVAAGVCLPDPAHPARQVLPGEDRRRPAFGLSPAEAQTFCSWARKRLPFDHEWDFAAAANAGDAAPAARTRYPFDRTGLELWADGNPTVPSAPQLPVTDIDLALSCIAGRADAAANFSSQADEACARTPLPVASFPSSHNRRGSGVPVADLAGNVWEWTLPGGVDLEGGNPNAPIPGGGDEVYIRGGNHRSGGLFLANEFNRLTVRRDDLDRFLVDENTFGPPDAVGFRCVHPGSEPPTLVEPFCPAPDL